MSIERSSPPAPRAVYDGQEAPADSRPVATERTARTAFDEPRGSGSRTELFRGLFEHASEAMLVLDSRGRILLLNRPAELMFGYDREELIGELVDSLIPHHVPERLRVMRRPLLPSADPVTKASRRPSTARRRDGSELPVEVTLRPLWIESGNCVLASVRDVSERLDLESNLRQAQKMETVGQLVTGVAHDFNNLLAIISGTLELVHGALPDDEEIRDDMDAIRGACDQATLLTRMLLTFSRRSESEPRVIELDRAIEGQASILRRLIGEHVQVQLQLGLGSWPVEIDPLQLEQILLNLGGNSRDAMPSGGTLTIATSALQLASGDSRLLPGMTPGPYALLTVTDTGHGMDPATLDRIFDPFFTTKKVGSGTGLGLATVKGLIRQSHGHVWCESAPGRGTSFSILLPRAERSVEQSIVVAESVPKGGRQTILLVDDDPHVLRVTRLMLERSEYTVLAASSGEEAIARVTEHTGPIDLLLTDILMPKMTGPQLARHIQALRPGIRTLFASGYAECPPDGEATLHADERVLIKPFSIRALTEAIEEALGQ